MMRWSLRLLSLAILLCVAAPPRAAQAQAMTPGMSLSAGPPPWQRRAGSGWDCPSSALWHMLQVGGGYTLASTGPNGYVLDLRAGALCSHTRSGSADDRGLHLIPEVGFSAILFNGAGASGAAAPPPIYLGTLGLAVGGGNRWWSAALQPRALLGSMAGAPALGLRVGPVLRVVQELGSLETYYQVLATGAGVRQDLVAMASVNVLVLIVVLGSIK